jgi:putative membrane protein
MLQLKQHQRKFRFFTLAAIALSLLITSCKKDRGYDYSMTDQEFVTSASSGNNFEIAAGALAQSKGSNTAVKHFGEHMVTDHSIAGSEMKALADQKGWTVMAANQMETKHQQNLAILTAASGSDFDKKFAQIMVDSHQETVTLFELGASDNGVPDGDLRNFAAAKLPTLRAHLQEAINLRTTVNP